jgi:hypothetical protein
LSAATDAAASNATESKLPAEVKDAVVSDEVEDVKTSAELETAMTNLMLGKGELAATPMGNSVKKIKNIIEKVMMKKVITAHNTDQRTLNKLQQAISRCGSTKNRLLNAARRPRNVYYRFSGYHRRCRNTEGRRYISLRQCNSQKRNLYRIKVMRCKYYRTTSNRFSATKSNRAIVNKAGGESPGTYITRISKTFCGSHVHGSRGRRNYRGGWGGGLPNGRLDVFLRAKYACGVATRRYNRKVRECNVKARHYRQQKSKCNSYQRQMDTSSCQHAVRTKDACEAYAGCYFTAVKAFKRYRSRVIVEERDRKAEWRGLNRMGCLIKAFANGKVTHAEINACKRRTINTRRLNIRYPRIPRLQRCILPTLYPSTGKYRRREFAPLPTVAKGFASAKCIGVRTVSTTPAL